jgi:uracil-DNA glycosylase
MATVHPSSLLRATDGREQEIARFVGDLRKAAQALGQAAS